jgi:hypothetical protein
MSYKTHTDNIYKEGTIIRAKAKPDLELVIMRYFQRTYYCSIVGDATSQHLAYFERELIPPSKTNHKK